MTFRSGFKQVFVWLGGDVVGTRWSRQDWNVNSEQDLVFVAKSFAIIETDRK